MNHMRAITKRSGLVAGFYTFFSGAPAKRCKQFALAWLKSAVDHAVYRQQKPRLSRGYQPAAEAKPALLLNSYDAA